MAVHNLITKHENERNDFLSFLTIYSSVRFPSPHLLCVSLDSILYPVFGLGFSFWGGVWGFLGVF